MIVWAPRRRADGEGRRDLHGWARRWVDNISIERLWRSLRHEDVYLKGYAGGLEAGLGIAAWMEFYNERRFHQALGYRAPMALWREQVARTTPVGIWTTLCVAHMPARTADAALAA